LALIYFCLPKPEALGEGSDDVGAYFITFLAFGLGAAMCGVINKKVFSDIVPSEIYTYVFAIDQLIEQTLGSLAPLSVGVLTDVVFHYDKDAVKEGECSPAEARKLGMGMFWVCNVAWVICFAVYIGMHWTYPKDRRRQLALRMGKAAPELVKGGDSIPEVVAETATGRQVCTV